jgi:hypothetical protein
MEITFQTCGCQEWGITLSKDKYQFGPVVSFARYIVNKEGTRHDPRLVDAINQFPPPTNLTDLRSLMGLINRFTDSALDLKYAMVPWQGLLKKGNAFVWAELHDKALTTVKGIITNPEGSILRHFEPDLPIQLLTDASRKGIGYSLVQMKKPCKVPRLIMAASRFLSGGEKNYVAVELELLAIQWVVQKCRMYLAGAQFTVVTDHQPLLGIMSGKNLDAINNVRIQRLMAKLLGFSYKVEWIARKNHVIADALSRAPVFAAEDHEDIIICKVTEEVPDPALTEHTAQAKLDGSYQEVIASLRSGAPVRTLNDRHPAQQYRGQWDAMAIEETYNFLTYHKRIIIPKAARKKILSSLHAHTTGRTKTLMNARQLYFWPGMTKDVNLMVSTCRQCTMYLPSQALEPQVATVASCPFNCVSIVLGHQKRHEYLNFVDRYSGWPMVKLLKRLDTEAIIAILDYWFLDHGKPVSIQSDGRPQFLEKFKAWCDSQHINHELSSAYHHGSNGHPECAVREMKHLLGKTNTFLEFRRGLMEYRSTPWYDGLSPAQGYYGRQQRTDAVALLSAYDRISDAKLAEHEARREEKMKKHQSHADQSSRPRTPMEPGHRVITQNMKTHRWDQQAIIVSRRPNGGSYVVNIDGRKHIRNRRFLRPSLVPDQTEATGPVATTMTFHDVTTRPNTTRRYPRQVRRPRVPFSL